MKCVLYRTFSWTIELPDNFAREGDILDRDEVYKYLDRNSLWPSLLDGEELYDEMEVVQLL